MIHAIWDSRKGKNMRLPVRPELMEAGERALNMASLDVPIDESDDELGDRIAGDEAVGYDDAADRVDEALDLLPPLARKILELRFGLNGNGRGDGQRMTIDELAYMFGVERQKIRSVESKCLRILRKKAPGLRALLTS